MNTDLSTSAKCYGLYDEDKIIGFMGVLHQPHPKNKKIKRVTRLVVLPDYQGIGLGTKFLDSIANIYSNYGYDFEIVTSAKNLIYSLNRNHNWQLVRIGINRMPTTGSIDRGRKTIRNKCKTASFFYKTKHKDSTNNYTAN